MRVSVLTNGPGELWGWVRPTVMELRRRGHSVSLWLLPCQFASGRERVVASQLGVDKLEGPGNAAWMWNALAREKTDCALQLGGDLMFGRRLAQKAGVPLLCYAYGPKRGMDSARLFTAWPVTARRMPGATVIGDLVRDSLQLDPGVFKWDDDGGTSVPRILFFPGSRPAVRRIALAWLSSVARSLELLNPAVRVATLFSPFMPDDELSLWSAAGLNPIKTGAGPAMRAADYALTQPGTNTLEMMHCGLPAMVVAPSDFLRVVPLSGLAGVASSLPLVGDVIRKHGIEKHLARYDGFMSWPNRVAERRVMEEMSGNLTPQRIAQELADALGEPEKLRRMRRELLALSGKGGAVLRLADAVEQAR